MSESKISTAEIVKSLRGCSADEVDCENCVEWWKDCKNCAERWKSSLYCYNKLMNYAADRLDELEKELQAARTEAAQISEDFVDYVCSGMNNPAPYCKNKSAECTTGRGWCVDGKCKGFIPKAWNGRAHE